MRLRRMQAPRDCHKGPNVLGMQTSPSDPQETGEDVLRTRRAEQLQAKEKSVSQIDSVLLTNI